MKVFDTVADLEASHVNTGTTVNVLTGERYAIQALIQPMPDNAITIASGNIAVLLNPAVDIPPPDIPDAIEYATGTKLGGLRISLSNGVLTIHTKA